MRISAKGEYALRAMSHLARNYGKGSVPLAAIAARERIPIRFLEQILAKLKGDGYVDSKRGPRGGYSLTRPPERISLAEVIRSMEIPMVPINCADSCIPVESDGRCTRADGCDFLWLWKDIYQHTADILEKTTFQDICERSVA